VALPKVSLALVVACALATATPRVASAQRITIDGRLPGVPAQTLIGPSYDIGANLGKQVGSNLFHSFGQFGLAKGDTAAFSGPATVNNVIGRVTGGSRSDIDGKIQSNIAGANLFLINPSGIVFGPNATVNVSGAFHASTADYIKMADGAKFQATHPDGSTLSVAPPAAFGFLTASPAKISVNGSTLSVPLGQTLGLVGGPVSITAASPTSTTGARLVAPAGTLHVTSAAGSGEVPVDPRNTSAMTVSKFGAVEIKGGSAPSILTASSPSGSSAGGSVFVRADTLAIDAGVIAANNSGSGPGGQLVLQADSKITLANNALVQARALSSGSGADIILRTTPGGAISIDNSAVTGGSTATGNGGELSVTTGQLTLTNGTAALVTTASNLGSAGNVSVMASGPVTIDRAVGPGSTAAGIGSQTSFRSEGDATVIGGTAGDVAVTAGALILNNTDGISSVTLGSGDAGKVTVNAGTLSINGAMRVASRSAWRAD
jgi:filamentous hemagglutinin family protein